MPVALAHACLRHVPAFYNAFNLWGPTLPTLGMELQNWVWATMSYFQPFRDHDWRKGPYGYGPVMWTIPIELKGSLLVYCLVGVACTLNLRPLLRVFLLSTVAAFLLFIGWWAPGCFIAGLILAIIHFEQLDQVSFSWHRSRPRIAMMLKPFCLLLAIYLLSQPASDGHPEKSLNTFGWHYLSVWIPPSYKTARTFFLFWPCIGAILLVWTSLRLSWFQAIFNTRILQYLGRISFMLYLIHIPLGYMIVDPYIMRSFGWSNGGWTRWDNWLYIPDVGPRGLSTRWAVQWTIYFGITVCVAHLATILVDDPCTRLSKYIGRKAVEPLPRHAHRDIPMQGLPLFDVNAPNAH